MTGPEIVYAAGLGICTWRLGWLKLWRELPVFFAFVAGSLVITLLPWHPKDLVWCSTWGLWTVDVPTFALSAAAVLELLRAARSKMRVGEFCLLQWSLVGMVLNCSFVFWRFVPAPAGGWYFRLMADRQFAMIELFAVALVLTLYAWAKEVEVHRFLRVHAGLLCALLAGRNLTNLCDSHTGLVKAFGWNALDSFWFLWSAACFMAWALVLPWLVSRERHGEL